MRATWASVVMLAVCVFAACDSDDEAAAGGGSGGTGGLGGGGTGGASGAATGGAAGAAGAAGTDASSEAGACMSKPITFTPSWTPPQPLHQGVCTKDQIDAIVKACFEGGGASACASARSAHPTCDACLISDDTASQRGAIIHFKSLGYYDRNYAGCVAHAQGDLTANGCGPKAQATYWDCPNESCADCFPISNNDFSPLNACAKDAYEGTCKTHVDAFNACATGFDFAHCIWIPATEAWAKMARRYGDLFCGSSADGGAGDAGDAGDSSG